MSLSYADKLERFYFLFQAGCAACEEAEPHLDRYLTAHPRDMAVKLSADGPFAERIGVKIRATPTYVYIRGAQIVVHEGALDEAELGAWLAKARKAESTPEEEDSEDRAPDDNADEESE